MKFSTLSEYLKKLEETPSRNTIIQILGELFKEAEATQIDKICYLLLGRVGPQYEGIEFNFAEKMMVRALGSAYNISQKEALRRYKKEGDLGNVAWELAKHPPSPLRLRSGLRRAGKTANVKRSLTSYKRLTVVEVYDRLYKIATESGGGSQERKLSGMAKLLQDLDPLSAKYVARIPVGKLRLGFSDTSMLDALSVMEKGDKSARRQIEGAYNVAADIGKIAQRIKKSDLRGLGHAKAEPGIPIRGSLAERLPTAQKVAEKLAPKFAIEPKMDGFRVALHVWGQGKNRQVRIFSRNLENVTDMFPEIVEAAKKLPVKEAIFDGEAIGYSPKTGKFFSFQETVQRKRKYGISELAKDIPLKVFVFDALYLNGKTLLEEPFLKRRGILEKALKGKRDTIILTDQKVISTAEELRKAFDEYISEGLEGIMAKKLDVAYQAGGRGYHWVKYKKHTESAKGTIGLADTIDCVLMGAYRGRGKRAGFGYGGFLLGIPDRDGKYYSLSNLGTGLTDEQFREMKKAVDKIKLSSVPKEYVVDKTVEPDVWAQPKIVLEILADEITLSPRHTAGREDIGRGYSLRFPRLMRVRDDKNPEQATSVSEIKKLYQMSR